MHGRHGAAALRRAGAVLALLALLLAGLAVVGARADPKAQDGAPGPVELMRAELTEIGQPGAPRKVELPVVLRMLDSVYRLTFTLDARRPGEAWAVLAPRSANFVRLEWNGQPLAQVGFARRGYSGNAHQPLREIVPPDLWRDGPQQITLVLAGDHLHPVILPPLLVGPVPAIEAEFDRLQLLQVELPWALAGAVLVLAMVALVVGLRGRDALYLLLAASACATAARMALPWVNNPGFAPGVWAYLYALSVPLLIASSAFFWMHALDHRPRPLVVGTWLFLLADALLCLPLLSGRHTGMPDSALLLCLAATLAIGGAIAWMTLTRPGRARLALALALAALGALVLGNLLLDGWQVFPHSIRQALVLAMIGFLALQTWELVERFNRALQSYRVNAAYFQQQLAVKRDELQATFAQLRDAERNEAVEEERRRIMREIHDGLGSTLVNAMALAKSGPTPPQLTQALQHSMDELRMAIDALQPHEDDLLTALGTLRSRIEPALKGAGIELVWRVEPVPRLPQLTAANTLHLYRFAQEAFANVVKHAGARSVTLATRHDAASGIVELTIDDDGCGWQPDAPGAQLGRGTHTMRLRAQQLGGELRIERRAEGGTRVALRLPVAATAEPPAAA